MASGRRRGLGRGLGALIPTADVSAPAEAVELLPLDRIQPSRLQPRQEIPPHSLEDLVASVRSRGVLQPVLVRPTGEHYELVAGERRWRAAKEAGLDRIPALVRPVSDAEALEIALIENLQRVDLNPVERARAYHRLITEFGLTQQQVAEVVGLSQPAVANALRLLSLPEPILQSLQEGRITEAHARLLVGVEDAGERDRLWRLVLDQGLSVRQLADLMARRGRKAGPARRGRRPDPDRAALEDALRARLATQVRIRAGRRKGVVEIEFYSEEDLSRICEVILGEGWRGV